MGCDHLQHLLLLLGGGSPRGTVVTGGIGLVPYLFPNSSHSYVNSSFIPLLSLALVVWKAALILFAYSLASL
jgi:hypothetical protein